MTWALTTTPPADADPPAGRARTVLNDVHTDTIDVRFQDGQLGLQTRIGNAPYSYAAASEVIFQLKDIPEAAIAVPDDPAFAFLGQPGDPLWLAPEVQDFSLLFAGWNTESIAPGVFDGDVVDLELTGMHGPGRLEVFQSGSFGEPQRIFSSSDSGFKTLRQPVHSHAHANWAFSALGRYELTFQAHATVAGGAQVHSAPVTYTWFVGGATAADVTPMASGTHLSASVNGSQVELTAAVEPSTAKGWVEFFDGSTSLGSAAIPATLTVTLAAGEHTLKARFIPLYSNDYRPSDAEPVTVTIIGGGGGQSPTTSPSPSASQSPPPAPTSPGTSAVTSTAACVPSNSHVPILSDGHADYGTRIVNGRLDSAVKDGTVAGKVTWRDPSEVVLHVKPQAAKTLPSGFGFLGAAGTTVWQIPQTQQSGVLWLGWNTEAIPGGQVEWTLTGVSGPGRFALYDYDPFGSPVVHFNSGDGLPDRFALNAGTHAHGTWAFTKQGVYRLTFTQKEGSLSDTETLTVVVGDTDPRPHALRTSGCGLPRTGLWLTGVLGAGGGLLATGTVLVVLARRRSRR